MFGLAGSLYEDLLVQVVVIVANVLLGLSKKDHDVNALVQLCAWQMRTEYIKAKLHLAQGSDVFIGPEVMWTEGRHLVEDMPKVFLDFIPDVYLLLEQIKIVHACIALDVDRTLLFGVELGHVWDQDTMDLHSQLLLCCLTYRPDAELRE